MADDHDNDVDAGWDDIEAGWEVEASKLKPKPEQSKSSAKPSAHEKITAETAPLPSMIPTPNVPVPEPLPEPPRDVFKVSEPRARPDEDDEPGFTEDDVTANRLYDEDLLAEAARKAKDEAVVTVEPLIEESDPDAHQEVTRDHTAELMEEQSAPQSKDTVKRIKTITARTERRLIAEAAAVEGVALATTPVLAAAPVKEPSGQAFEVPSPLKTSGSGPAAVQSQLEIKKPSGVNLSLVVFILLLVLALGAVGAVILAAFF